MSTSLLVFLGNTSFSYCIMNIDDQLFINDISIRAQIEGIRSISYLKYINCMACEFLLNTKGIFKSFLHWKTTQSSVYRTSTNVVFQYRWSLIQVSLYLDVFDSARKVGMALLEVVIRAAQSKYSNNKHKIPLHIITYLIISLEPIVAPSQKFYEQ